MSAEKIIAEKRTEFGKGAARRIRRENKIPAVMYGHGNDPIHLTLPGHDTMMAIKHGGANALLELDLEGTRQLALVKQVQVDHIRRVIEHVDFVAVRAGEKVTVEVPVNVTGDAAPDALVMTDLNAITVETEATHVPESIEVSVEGLQPGTQILAKDVTLPKGTTLVTDADVLVVNITGAPTAEQIEAELEEAEAEVGIVHDEPTAEAGEGESAEAGEATESE